MAFDMFLKLNGIVGTGTNGAIPVDSFSFGLEGVSSVGASTGAAGRRTHSPITITRVVDSTSPALFTAAENGRTIGAGSLTCIGTVLLPAVQDTITAVYSFSDIEISSIVQTGNRRGDIFPTEQITFSFYKLEFGVSLSQPSTIGA